MIAVFFSVAVIWIPWFWQCSVAFWNCRLCQRKWTLDRENKCQGRYCEDTMSDTWLDQVALVNRLSHWGKNSPSPAPHRILRLPCSSHATFCNECRAKSLRIFSWSTVITLGTPPGAPRAGFCTDFSLLAFDIVFSGGRFSWYLTHFLTVNLQNVKPRQLVSKPMLVHKATSSRAGFTTHVSPYTHSAIYSNRSLTVI